MAEIQYDQKDAQLETIMATYHKDIGKIGGFSVQKSVHQKDTKMEEPHPRLFEEGFVNLVGKKV